MYKYLWFKVIAVKKHTFIEQLQYILYNTD